MKRKNMDLESQINRVMLPTTIFMLVFMVIGFVIALSYQSKYISGQITQEEWMDGTKIVMILMMADVILPIAFLTGFTIWFKIERLKYENEQLQLHTFSGTVTISPFDINLYQIQTLTPNADSDTVQVTDRMIYILKQTKAFQAIKDQVDEKGGIQVLDHSNLFNLINEDIQSLKAKGLLKKEVKKLLLDSKSTVESLKNFKEKNKKGKDQEEDDLLYLDKFGKDLDKMETQINLDEKDFENLELIEKSMKDLETTEMTEKLTDLFKTYKNAFLKQNGDEVSSKYKSIRDTHDDPMKKIIINYDLLVKLGLLSEIKESRWGLGFRRVTSIYPIDRPELEETYYDEKLKMERYIDDFMNIDAFAYLIPDREKDIFKFVPRLSEDGNYIKVKKCYAQWTFLGWLIDYRVPLLLCRDSSSSTKIHSLKLSSHTIKDAEEIALSQLCYMSYNQDEALRGTVNSQKSKIASLETEIDRAEVQTIDKFLSRYDLTHEARKALEFRPPNATTILLMIVAAFLGFFANSYYAAKP